MRSAGTIELVAKVLANALAPLERRLSSDEVDDLFARLGLKFSSSVVSHTNVRSALQLATSVAGELPSIVASLTNAIDAGDSTTILARSAATLSKLGELFGKLDLIGSELGTLANAFPGVSPSEISSFAADLPRAILELAIIEHFEQVIPDVTNVLAITGIIDRHTEPGKPGDPAKVPFEVKRLRLDRLRDLLRTPAAYAQSLYGWGSSSFDGRFLIQQIAELAWFTGLPALVDPGSSGFPSVDLVFFDLAVDKTVAPPGLRINVRVPVRQNFNRRVLLSQPGWFGEIKASGKFDAGLVGSFKPPALVFLTPPTGPLTGSISAGFVNEPGISNLTLLGLSAGTRLEARRVGARLSTDLLWDSASATAQGAPKVKFEISGGKLLLDPSPGDEFIQTLTSGKRSEVDFGLAGQWDITHGIRFEGSSTLEIAVPTYVTVGSITVDVVYIVMSLEPTGVPLELSAAISSKLGPLSVSIDRIGLLGKITFPSDKGNLGPLNIGFGFKPPNGVGLSVDAGVVKGGGFLGFYPERGEYAGNLELVFSGFLTLKAIGLITTKLPDGSKGFSLLIIITAEFATGIQLGYGFTLLAVGGLLGLNRTMRLQPLAEGVRTGAINSILFPKDVIANAPRIISDLRTIFPPEEGKFLIGPMAKLGWGTPTLISISLGIIIEIPGNIAILGVLRVALPTDELALIVLQVNFIGAIEFDKKRIWFFASLFESRYLYMTFEGEMGLLVAFGDDANFVVSVGGFHPQFNPPPLPFPNPARISVNYINESYARIRVMNYFAVTSNSAQIGAHAELFFGFDEFSVEGHIGYDALIQFSPFLFIIEVSASVALKAFGVGVFSIGLRFSLQGPTPFRAKGTGSISLFFFDISADFDITWGEDRNTTLPPIEVMPILKAEFEKIDNWRALLPASNNLLVSLRKLDTAADTLVLHPVGVLRISQKAIPLDLPIDKVGNQKTSDAKQLRVNVTSTGLGKRSDAQEQFAIAQFQNMEDASKLSRPAYEPQHGGLELSVTGQQLASSRMVKRVIRYEEIIIDNNFKRFVRHFSIFVGALFNHFMAGASISKSSLSQSYLEKLQPFDEKIAVQPASYVVAFQATNKSIGTAATFTSQASATNYMQQQIALDPNMSDALHVIPTHEVSV